MRRLTFSRLELAERCLFPFRDDVTWDVFVPGKPLLIGQAFGEFAYSEIAKKPCPAPVGLDDEDLEILELYKEHWKRGDYKQAEIAIAFNVVTGEVRYLGENIGREYDKHGAGPDDVCGSIDACTVHPVSVKVGEWKTGAQRKLHRYGNKQARGYAAALARYAGAMEAEVEVQIINDEGGWSHPETMDLREINAELDSIVRKAEEIELLKPEPNPGPHCKECPAAGGCPAVRRDTEALMKHHLPVLATHEDVAAVIGKLEAYEAQAAAIWNAVKARVAELGDVKLSDGRVYGECERHNESIVAEEALPILEAEGVKAPTKVSLTKKSIKEAIRKIAAKGQAAKMERTILAKLRDSNAMKESTSYYYGFRKG